MTRVGAGSYGVGRAAAALSGAFALMASAPSRMGHVEWVGTAIAAVEKAARSGDGAAALEIGRRYETGTGGASCDPRRALHWYGKAARPAGATRFAYSPPVGREQRGRFMQVGNGAAMTGIPEAARRQAALKARIAAAGGDPGMMGCPAGGPGQ